MSASGAAGDIVCVWIGSARTKATSSLTRLQSPSVALHTHAGVPAGLAEHECVGFRFCRGCAVVDRQSHQFTLPLKLSLKLSRNRPKGSKKPVVCSAGVNSNFLFSIVTKICLNP